jgi:hypothetical protein
MTAVAAWLPMRQSSSMRRATALAFLILAAALAGCGASHGSPRATRPAGTSSLTGHLLPSGFVVRPDIANPLCNGGRGVRLSIPSWQEDGEGRTATTSSGTIAGGSTVIAFSGYQRKSLAVLHSVTPRCELDRQFGSDGTATISIPSSLRPTHGTADDYLGGLAVYVMAARNGGGAIVAGNYEGAWVVGEVTGRGQLDPSFGNGGWSVLPYEGGVTAVLQEPSGRIIVAGEEHSSGCCTVTWAAALSAHGQLERGFGGHGRVELPTGEDSGVSTLELEPGGDILTDVSGGNMGCWYTKPAMLTPSGELVPLFATRLARFWQRLGLHAFVGDIYIEGEGFTLVGTGQKPCYDSPPRAAPRATGLIAHFQPNGEPAGLTIRFSSQMKGGVQALSYGGETFILDWPYSKTTGPTVTARRSDGSLDPRFGHLGRTQIHLPKTEGSTERLTGVTALEAGPGEITLLTTLPERAELQLTRLHL